MKKLLYLISSILVIGLIFTGCGSKTPARGMDSSAFAGIWNGCGNALGKNHAYRCENLSLQIGKDGIGENLIKQADDALEARELIKGRVLDNNLEYDARAAAEELAKATRSEVVQVIGTKFVLYRESHSKPKEKRIQLVKPARKKPQA